MSNSAAGMRPNRTRGARLNVQSMEYVRITAILSHNRVRLQNPLASTASAGNRVSYFDWSDTIDIERSPQTTLCCCYGKVLVRPIGSTEAPYSHIELQIKQTFGDAIVREGERVPVIVGP